MNSTGSGAFKSELKKLRTGINPYFITSTAHNEPHQREHN